MDKRDANKVKVGDRLRVPFFAKTITVVEVITTSDDERDALPLFRSEGGLAYSYRLCRREG